jgi:hypothetical protein
VKTAAASSPSETTRARTDRTVEERLTALEAVHPAIVIRFPPSMIDGHQRLGLVMAAVGAALGFGAALLGLALALLQ